MLGISGTAAVRRSDVGEEDVAPTHDGAGRGGRDVAHVENLIGELFGEDSRLDVGGELRGDQLVEHAVAFVNRPRREPQRRGGGGEHAEESEEQDGRDHAAAGNAGGSHGGDLSVGGHAAEGEKDSGEYAQGDRGRERLR